MNGRSAWSGSMLALLLTAYPPNRLTAQRASIGVQGVLGDYREVSDRLHYRGSGPGAVASFSYRKLSADVAVARIDYEPVGSTAYEKFTATQIDAHLRYFLFSAVSLELGALRRRADPEFEAQSTGAIRLGARGSYAIGPSATLLLRGNYLAACKFSGGGTAGFGVELGLGVSAGPGNGRFRVTGDYEFQRIDRKTNPGGLRVTAAPLQQSLARLGVAVNFLKRPG